MAKVYDPIMCMMVEQMTNDTRTCDADPVFKNIYDSFISSLKAAEKMSPKDAGVYIDKITAGRINDLDKRFNTLSAEYNRIRNQIRRDNSDAQSKAYERYMREGKT